MKNRENQGQILTKYIEDKSLTIFWPLPSKLSMFHLLRDQSL